MPIKTTLNVNAWFHRLRPRLGIKARGMSVYWLVLTPCTFINGLVLTRF